MSEKVRIISSWKLKTKFHFNTIHISRIFRFSDSVIILGKEDGVVEFLNLPHSKAAQAGKWGTSREAILTLESKGGPIQNLLVHDVTRLYNNDLIVADSKGMVTFFCNEQILCRRTLSDTCITCMKAHTDPLGNVCVLIGDGSGHVTAFNPYKDLWRLRVSDVKAQKGATKTSGIRCLLPLELTDGIGQTSSYVLAADDSKHLHFIQSGVIVKTLSTPHLINTMCSGHFIQADGLEMNEAGEESSVYDLQVALGSETGAIYMISNFEIYTDEYANIQVPIKQLETLKAGDSQSTDTLLCTGQFDGMSVIRNSKEIERYKTSSWVTSMVLSDMENDGVKEIVLGCHDNTIEGLRIKFS